MLIPQFTIRTILILTTIVAVLAWIVSQGVAGAKWAQCIAWSCGFVTLLFAAYALVFVLAFIISNLVAQRSLIGRESSPFATPQASELQPPAE